MCVIFKGAYIRSTNCIGKNTKVIQGNELMHCTFRYVIPLKRQFSFPDIRSEREYRENAIEWWAVGWTHLLKCLLLSSSQELESRRDFLKVILVSWSPPSFLSFRATAPGILSVARLHCELHCNNKKKGVSSRRPDLGPSPAETSPGISLFSHFPFIFLSCTKIMLLVNLLKACVALH